MLERWYVFGRIDWTSELEYPEFTNKEVNRFFIFDLLIFFQTNVRIAEDEKTAK